jgi:transposase
MQHRKNRWQEDLFVACPLRDMVPDDHILSRVDAVLDLDWLHGAVAPCYCRDNGRPSIDPESALRLMLAGFFQGIVSDRQLMREAQVNLAIRWFAGYRLDETLPDASSFTRIRQRWGEALFREIFERTVCQFAEAGLVDASTVHVDATLIRADVSWDSLVARHADQVIEANDVDDDNDATTPPGPKRGRPRTKPPKQKKYSPTDPEATMATSCNHYHLEPTYKQHMVVEDRHGIIVDVAVTTGEVSEGQQLPEQLGRVEKTTGATIETVTADAAYAHGRNYAALEANGVDAVIPPPKPSVRRKGQQKIPACRFKYHELKNVVMCPNRKCLERKGRDTLDTGTYYRARACDCAVCPMRPRCVSPGTRARSILIRDGHTAVLRARRRKQRGWDEKTRACYVRHRWRVEGVHGRAKTQHGLRRAIRRGRINVSIQSLLTAAVMNLKKLAMRHRLRFLCGPFRVPAALFARITGPSAQYDKLTALAACWQSACPSE